MALSRDSLLRFLQALKQPRNYFLVAWIIMFLFTLFQIRYADYELVRARDIICFRDLEQGQLYSGIPRCFQGPLYYYAFYPLEKLLGSWYDGVLYLLNTFLHLLLLFFLYKILQKELHRSYMYITLALYLPLIFVNTTHNLEGFYAMVALVAATYVLLYSGIRYKYFIAGLLYSVSLNLKLNAIIPFLIVFTIYFLTFIVRHLRTAEHKHSRFTFAIKLFLTRHLFFFIGFLMPFIISLLLHGNLLYYYYLAYLKRDISFLQAWGGYFGNLFSSADILSMITSAAPLTSFELFFWHLRLLDPRKIFIILIFFASFWITLRAPFKAYKIVAFLGFALLVYASLSRGASPYYRYLVIVLPFVILSFVDCYSQLSSHTKRCLFSIFLFSIVFLAYQSSYADGYYYNYRFTPLKQIAEYPLNAYVPNGYTIVTDEPKVFSEKKKEDLSLEYLPAPFDDYRDVTIAEKLAYFGVLNSSWADWRNDWVADRFKDGDAIAQRLANGFYDAVIIGPAGGGSYLVMVYYKVGEALEPVRKELLGNKTASIFDYDSCFPFFLSLAHECPLCRHTINIIFKDHEDCVAVGKATEEYYVNHFDEICALDKFLGVQLARILQSAGKDRECRDGGEVLSKTRGGGVLRSRDNLYFFLVAIMVIVAYHCARCRKKEKSL